MKIKQINIEDFQPTRPEKDGIRYLRGKRALAYEKAWNSTNTLLEIGNFRKFFLDIRLYIVRLIGLPKDYFHERHRYDSESRRLLDNFALTNYELKMKHTPDAYYSPLRKILYKYIKFRYRKEGERFNYWMRITSHAKRGVYIWHEDIEKYNEQHDIHKMTDAERDEFERRLII